MKPEEIQREFGVSANGNFQCVDSIPVPHPYCITPKHLEHNRSMYLDVEAAERRSKEAHPNDPRKWAVCDICRQLNRRDGKPILSFAEHKQALIVACKIDYKGNEEAQKELHQYLLAQKEKATEHHFVGFAFMMRDEWEHAQATHTKR